MCHAIFKKTIAHLGEDEIGKDVRRIHMFDAFNKLQIKTEEENLKILDPVQKYEYGGVRSKSREEAIMIQDIMTQRLAEAKINTSLKAFDGVNAFNSMTQEHKKEIFKDSVYHLAVKEQNMEHVTYIQNCDTICLLKPGTGVPQGGVKATDIFNKGMQEAMRTITQKTAEVSPLLVGEHPYLLHNIDPIMMRGEPLPVQVATTTFVDDVINRVAHKKIDELAENTKKWML